MSSIYKDRFDRVIIDNENGTFSANGIIIEPNEKTINAAINVFNGMIPEGWIEPPKPLDSIGSLATLLVVTGILNIEDAANAVRLTPIDLTTEAEAWAIASITPQEIL